MDNTYVINCTRSLSYEEIRIQKTLGQKFAKIQLVKVEIRIQKTLAQK